VTRAPPSHRSTRHRGLQTFVVRYTEVAHRGVAIDRPLLRGRFTWRGRKWEARSLTDSGADHCFLPKEAADHLGLELVGEPRTIDVVGSTFEAMEAEVFFQVLTSPE
jgi:hypothetical protein